MPRKENTPPADCKCGAVAICHYDVCSDEFFVECTVCDEQGPRHEDERQAKILWTKYVRGTT